MAGFNGSGGWDAPAGQPVVTGTTIDSTVFNLLVSTIDTSFETCITRNGQSPATANLPMGSFKLTGLAAGSAATDSANLGQIQAAAYIWCGTAGGTANALTLSPTPAITAYAAGQIFRAIILATNTGAAAVVVSGLASKAITKQGSVALVGSEMRIGAVCDFIYDGTQFQLMEPAQGLLQAVSGTGAGGSTSSVTPTFANLITSVLSITPKSALSRLFIEASFTAQITNVAATNTTGSFSLYETNTATPIGLVTFIQAPSGAGGVGASAPSIVRAVLSSTGIVARTFGYMGYVNVGAAVASATNYVITIMEVL
jgi:hypothetical protein